MKRLVIICILLIFACWLCATCLHAAVPTFESFPTNQYQTNGLQVYYRAVHTNDLGIIYPSLDNSLSLVTNQNVYGTFSLPSKVTILALGTNYLDLSTNSTWLLNSPTNDATQVILSLSAGQYQGQLAFFTSQNGGNSFTLPDLSEQWDVPGAYVDIQGDWIGTTNRGIILQYTAPDWIEMARFDPAQSGGGTVLGGGTTPFLPYWLNSSTLTNSPLSRSGASSVQIAQGGGFLQLGVGSGIPFISGINLLQISAGVGVLQMNGGSYLTPESGGVGMVLGVSTNYFGGLFLGTNGLHGEYTDDGSQLLRNGVPLAGGTNSPLWGSLGGVLYPAPAVDVVSITSQLADSPTNVALIVNTLNYWTNAPSVKVNSGGTNVFAIGPRGGVFVGADTVSDLGSGLKQVGFIAESFYTNDFTGNAQLYLQAADSTNYNWSSYIQLTTQGTTPAGSSVRFEAVNDVLDGWKINGQANDVYFKLNVAGNPLVDFEPTVISSGSAVAYTFDTSNDLTTGDKLVTFANHGTNKMYLTAEGTLTLGQAPSWWGAFSPSLLLFSNTDHGYSGAWEIFAGGGSDVSGTNYSFDAVGNNTQAGAIVGSATNYVNTYANNASTSNAGIEISNQGTKRTFITPSIASGSGSSAYYLDTQNSLAATESLLTVLNHGTNKFSVSNLGAITIAGTTNQVTFGATNTAPASAVAPTKWISVKVAGDSGVYRIPLYE